MVGIRIEAWPESRTRVTPCLGHGIVETRSGTQAFGKGDCLVVEDRGLRVCTECKGGRREPGPSAACRRE